MNIRLIGLVVVMIGFGALSTIALLDVGYLGILKPHFQSWGEAQVFADLVILGVLACLWMAKDAPKQGLTAWPFIILTLALGSFGPLIYLAVREVRAGGKALSAHGRAQSA